MGDALKGNLGPPTDEPYVTGDTNWESFDLPALIAMVNEKVDVPALIRLADDWRWTGDGTAEAAQALADALDELMHFWSGAAAEQARTDVALNAQWLFDLGTRASEMGAPVEEAAGAIKAARDQMPHLPEPGPAGAPGSATDGAAAGERAGGPLGAAIGAAAAGSDSAAQAAQQQADLYRQAVETMRRFEAAAIGIDQSIPRFEGPSPVLRPRPEPAPARPPVSGTVTVVTDTTLTWQELTGLRGDGTSAQQYTGSGSGGGASVGGWPAQVGGGGPATDAPHAMPGRVAGPGTGTGAVPQHERAPGMLPAASAMPVDPDGPAGMGGAAPMAGMGAGAGGSKDDDHRRRYPFDADGPFSPDRKASPPVIGL